MILRPRATTWFELLTSRDHFAVAMQALAHTRAVQLEAHPFDQSAPVLPVLDDFFDRFHQLEARYGPYWPQIRGTAGLVLENPIAAVAETQARLADWAMRADPIVADLRTSEARLGELALIDRLVEAVPDHLPLARLAQAQGSVLRYAVFFLHTGDAALPALDGVLAESFPAEQGAFVILVGPADAIEAAAERATALDWTPVPLPTFLSADRDTHVQQVRQHITETERDLAGHLARLDALAEETGLAELLQRVAVLSWLRDNAGEISASPNLMRITGWNSVANSADIHRALEAAGVDYALTQSAGSAGDAPMVLNNPAWLRAFEFFPRLLGMPANQEVDPSAATALIAPLLFGFMFGDVGQGAVLLAAGLYLGRRWPMLALFVPGGVMAMVFGVLFGSVFSLEGVIPALWVHPLHAPITVLAAALVIGAVLLTLGFVLDFTQAAWHGQGSRWLAQHGGLMAAFLGLLGAWFEPRLAWSVVLGLGLTAVGARKDGAWTPAAAAVAVAEFVEAIMRLLVSTVSFARVGAFALAHAGLSAAIVGIAEALGPVGFWIALLLGNLLILGLEGLVTGIQTTRLILFEFFIRFFHATGREFRPLQPPGQLVDGGSTS
ncbi:V-type ATPase 116kDa subunit family protein [Mesobacterium sp. TK19101]|uniref:V-type ATPase 116kDa subunit family protein n=1 Tax=Mesobacterium hydrothermale TaxID=3111907 RepID=A0ABU6HL11_9RHOB|nr:V-type ATPase 116kDa subunit family protein [Mesobacterium sp. TK19101]MEC3862782.1 V-type ATPase 116kDa subunit family protein [Mesobacterium sp. TK19101]